MGLQWVRNAMRVCSGRVSFVAVKSYNEIFSMPVGKFDVKAFIGELNYDPLTGNRYESESDSDDHSDSESG